MGTGSELFSLITCLHTTTFISVKYLFPSFYMLKWYNSLNACVHERQMKDDVVCLSVTLPLATCPPCIKNVLLLAVSHVMHA